MITSSLRIITIFFTMSFSLALFSMDLPGEEKNTFPRCHGQELNKKDSHPLALPSMNKDSLGKYFHTFSSDLLNRFLVCDLDSRGKESFRLTNKLLSRLLSCETPQDFIFQNNLNVSKKNILELIVKTFNIYKKNEIPAFKLKFIKELSSQFTDKSAITEDVVARYSSKIIGLSETLKWDLICRGNEYFNCFFLNDMKISSYSLIVACATRDSITLGECLKSISKDDFSKNLRRALHIVIQNNDINSFMLIMASKKMSKHEKRSALNRMASELVQLGLFCASDKVMDFIITLYKTAQSMCKLDYHQPLREENFLANWIDTPVEVKDPILHAIIAQYYFLLSEIHKNDSHKFQACLKIVFGDNEFLNNLPNNPANNHAKKSILRRRITNCSVM